MPTHTVSTTCPHCSKGITITQEIVPFPTGWGEETNVQVDTPICPECHKELSMDMPTVPEPLKSEPEFHARPPGFGQVPRSLRQFTRGWS